MVTARYGLPALSMTHPPADETLNSRAVIQAFSVAFSMKERVDSMGQPAEPPEVRVARPGLTSRSLLRFNRDARL